MVADHSLISLSHSRLTNAAQIHKYNHKINIQTGRQTKEAYSRAVAAAGHWARHERALSDADPVHDTPHAVLRALHLGHLQRLLQP